MEGKERWAMKEKMPQRDREREGGRQKAIDTHMHAHARTHTRTHAHTHTHTSPPHLARVPCQGLQVTLLGCGFPAGESFVLRCVCDHCEHTSHVGREFAGHPTDDGRRLVLVKLKPT